MAERQALLAERDRVQARWAEEWLGYERRRESARERLAEARALLREAESFAAEVEAEALTAALNHDVLVCRLEARVRAGASEHIGTFCRDVRDQLEVLRVPGVVDVAERWGRRDPHTGKREHWFVSNADSIERRRVALMAALRDGIPEAEPFTVEAADPFTPAERREIEWRLAETREARS